jgi:uncharacterized protein YdeI (BOF family)
MATGFQRDVRRRALRFFARHAQRVHFRVRFTGAIVKTFADDLAIFNDHAADIRVWVRGEAPRASFSARAMYISSCMGSVL